MKKPILLMILDGYGIEQNPEGNAIAAAHTPNLKKIFNENPTTELLASGLAVGLPDGQMGNSEVGHTNIGAGRVVYQELTRISKAIVDGDFFENKALLKAIENCKESNTNLHVMGLLSDGGVHSHIEHIIAVVKLAKISGLSNVYVDCFLDGRDTHPTSGTKYLELLQTEMDTLNFGVINSVSGRYYAMDRDNRWDRVELAYSSLVKGKGQSFSNATEYVKASYSNDVNDEFIKPAMFNSGKVIAKNDSVIFCNFRPDRAREITRTLIENEFNNFETEILDLCFVSMTQYDDKFKNVSVAYPPEKITNTLGEVVANKGLKQLRIAETEKYAHVTFFFNAGIEAELNGEDRVLVSSPNVATYDLQPEMSATELTNKVIEEINKDYYDLIILNYANCDMVGHTGNFDCAVKAVETVDACVKIVTDLVSSKGGITMITADHGNADKMFDSNGVFTAHTTNPVPFTLIGAGDNVELGNGHKLADIAPTILNLMNLDIPKEMTGINIVK